VITDEDLMLMYRQGSADAFGELSGRYQHAIWRLTTRIDFATIELRLEEERHAGLTVSPPSVRVELRNAAVDGVRDAAEFAISLMLLMQHIGPTVALGAAALAWPLWALWRRRLRAQVLLGKS
jgi:hypothetical protein